MNKKQIRVKQIKIAIEKVNKDFKELVNNSLDDIDKFKLLAIIEKISFINKYISSLEEGQPPELDKLQRDYNILLAKHQQLQQRHKNLIDNIKN